MYNRTAKEVKRALLLLNVNQGAIIASEWKPFYGKKFELPHFAKEIERKDINERFLSSLNQNIRRKIETILSTTKARKIIYIDDINEAEICAEEESLRNLESLKDKMKKSLSDKDKNIVGYTSYDNTDIAYIHINNSQHGKRVDEMLAIEEQSIFIEEYQEYRHQYRLRHNQ